MGSDPAPASEPQGDLAFGPTFAKFRHALGNHEASFVAEE